MLPNKGDSGYQLDDYSRGGESCQGCEKLRIEGESAVKKQRIDEV
jgi:hypothetical protein